MKSPWIFLLAFSLIFYANGAGFIESFVNYPSWRLIGSTEFLRYHQFIGPRVIAFLVGPAFTASVLTVAMLRYRPAPIPLWSVWIAVALQVIIWVSTAAIQIPIQVEFGSTGFSEDRVAWLISSNFWLRRIPNALTAGLFLWMMHKVVSAAHGSADLSNKAPEPTPIVIR
jgi:hypothetical protein